MSRICPVLFSFFVAVLPARAQNVTLPAAGSDQGLLVRLFLAESRNPGHSSYNADDARRGMQAMKAVVENRLKNHPEQFSAAGARRLCGHR